MPRAELNSEEIVRRAEELNNSREIYAWRISDHPEVKSALQIILQEMKDDGQIGKRYENKYKRHIQVIVLDLFVAHMADPTMFITYSRNQNDYREGAKYARMFLSYRVTIRIIDFLIKNEYVKNERGFYVRDNPANSRKSRMRATEKLINIIEEQGVSPLMIKNDENEEVIILRDENKDDIAYEDNPEIIKMRDNVKFINQNLERNAIFLDITDDELKELNKRLKKNPEKGPIDFTKKRLRRVFNNSSFVQGGRFYGGWWQNIPREYRHYIKINDKDVVELDYSGLHINMLYALKNTSMPDGDVYELDEYPQNETLRRFIKFMAQALINASDREAARKALHKAVHYDQTLELPKEIESTRQEDIYPLMDAFIQKHIKITDDFCSGRGVYLQYFDSIMAEKVLVHFSKKQIIGILPLHDSFILHHHENDYLKEEMEKAFFDMFKREIDVDLKYNSIKERRKEEKARRKERGEDDMPRPLNMSTREIMEWEAKSSIYWNLLGEHRRLSNKKHKQEIERLKKKGYPLRIYSEAS